MQERFDLEEEGRIKVKAATTSIASNSFLIAIEGLAALLSGSIAILAGAIHSMLDLGVSITAYWGVREGTKPPDLDHLYGHGKFESMAGVFEAVLFFFASLFVIYEAVKRVTDPPPISQEMLAVGIIVTSIMVNVIVSRYLLSVSRKYCSIALEASAYDLISDILCSVAVLVGFFFILIGYPIADPLVAIIVAVFVFRSCYDILRKSAPVLLDKSPPMSVMEAIESAALSVKDVKGCHKVRARRAGRELHMDLHLEVSNTTSVEKAHNIATEVEKRVKERLREAGEVLVHVEPEKVGKTAASD